MSVPQGVGRSGRTGPTFLTQMRRKLRRKPGYEEFLLDSYYLEEGECLKK